MIFFYGTRASHIHTATPQATCLTCHTTGTHTLSTFGRYVHLYWIPLISIGKVSVSECQHCRVTHDEKAMPTQLRELATAQDRQVSAPFWHWTGLGLFGTAMLVSVIVNIMSPEESQADTPKRAAVSAVPTNEAVDEAYGEETRRRNDKAAPDEQRAALAADPQVGDVYTYYIPNEDKPATPARTVLTILSLTETSARCKLRTVMPVYTDDSTVVEQEITYPRIALTAMEKNGGVQTIARK